MPAARSGASSLSNERVYEDDADAEADADADTTTTDDAPRRRGSRPVLRAHVKAASAPPLARVASTTRRPR